MDRVAGRRGGSEAQDRGVVVGKTFLVFGRVQGELTDGHSV